MSNTKSSFLEKIIDKWWRKKENILPPSSNSRSWDGTSMGFPSKLKRQQIKWLRLYLKLGTSKKATRFFNRAHEEIAQFFTKEQLAEQRMVYEGRLLVNGKSQWEETVRRHIDENNIDITLNG